ncbi:MAG: lipoyl synthase [Anaerolineae bacterium]|nr:lipoyl synthase [Anaerolineae bacterium]
MKDAENRPERRPEWLKVPLRTGEEYHQVKRLMRAKHLHTVCEEANCPNIGECWRHRTATFLILGDTCTRVCRFCNIRTGRPGPLDPDEPRRVAEAVQAMDLRHAVITSVTRDDLPDGGAAAFAEVVRQIRALQPGCTVEVLIPDFQGQVEPLRVVMESHPEVLNHNVETVPRLFDQIQPRNRYAWSLDTLCNAKRLWPGALTKSGLMVGMGETEDEVLAVMRDLRAIDVDILTIGQYLQPTRRHTPIERYVTPDEFERFREAGLEMGFRWVESSPLVRSSFHAGRQVEKLLLHRHTRESGTLLSTA